jgi:hypothetical protein
MASENRQSADYCARLEKALREAMGVFGEDSVEAMVMALKNKYGIRIGSPPAHLLKRLKKPLQR